jgi:tRNA A37 threonylcarbamoyltransferase TsaD
MTVRAFTLTPSPEYETVLLVGGFGSNKYLGYKLKTAMQNRKTRINVSQIADS